MNTLLTNHQGRARRSHADLNLWMQKGCAPSSGFPARMAIPWPARGWLKRSA
jgi:hypothetical protein